MKNILKSVFLIGLLSLISGNLQCVYSEGQKTTKSLATSKEALVVESFQRWFGATFEKFLADILVDINSQKDCPEKKNKLVYSKELCALEKDFMLTLFEFRSSYDVKFFAELVNSGLKNIQKDLASKNIDKSEKQVQLWALGLAADTVFNNRLFPAMAHFSFRNQLFYTLSTIGAMPFLLFLWAATGDISYKKAGIISSLLAALPIGLAVNLLLEFKSRKRAFLSKIKDNKDHNVEEICLNNITMPDKTTYKPWEMFQPNDSFSVQRFNGMPFELALMRDDKPYAKGIDLSILLGDTSRIYTDDLNALMLRAAQTCHEEYAKIIKNHS